LTEGLFRHWERPSARKDVVGHATLPRRSERNMLQVMDALLTLC